MKIRGLGRLQSITRRIQNRISANAVILLYHRVNEHVPDPQRLAVTPAHFSEHLSLLTEMTDPVPLKELPARLKSCRRNDRPLSVITFDDGYADNLELAAPILARHAVPATVFVAAAAMNPAHEFYWDALERILLCSTLPDVLELQVGSRMHRWDFSGGSCPDASWDVRQEPGCEVQKAYRDLSKRLRSLVPAEREEVLEQLFAWSGVSRQPGPWHRAMSEEDLYRLTADGLIDVGAHTVNHPALSALDPQAQAEEIHESRTRLEKVLNRPVSTFSYPYGRGLDYSGKTVKLVREEGFSCACSNFPGLAGRWTDRFQLPRICVQNQGGEFFSQTIRHVCDAYS